ncbi:hypothetical protein PAHAL_2G485000 [Panicum hallii]|uniref:Uncharacterized protein n=1 Tax=Panicum hallii TaxID=206008 RepID=A0A2T8KTA7_9POAL|nr:hypothetical protein PAHAL_2G485000 [Panicum hallii]
MRCLVVSPPSPALCAASTAATPPGTLAISPPVAGGRACLPRLRPGETLRHRCLQAARAQNQNHGRSRNAQPRVETNYFLEEKRHILSRFVKINGSPERYLVRK